MSADVLRLLKIEELGVSHEQPEGGEEFG